MDQVLGEVLVKVKDVVNFVRCLVLCISPSFLPPSQAMQNQNKSTNDEVKRRKGKDVVWVPLLHLVVIAKIISGCHFHKSSSAGQRLYVG